MKSLHHINIINFIDFIYDNENEYIFILMEYAEKGDLEKKILSLKTQETYLDEESILDYFIQICHGIKYMHDKKIIHRDLKLQNILITKNNKIKIGDFGLAKLLNLSSKAYTFIGTPFYISPEIINGEPYDYKTDIWALGIILYQLCNLNLPFYSDNLAQLSIKIINGKFDPIRENINNEIKKLVKMMLDVNKENRPSINDILQMEFIKKNNKYNKNNKLKNSNSTKFLNSFINNRYSVYINDIFSKKSFNEIQNNFKNYCHSDKKPNNKFLNNNNNKKVNKEKISNNKNLNQIKIYKSNLNNNKFKQINNNYVYNNDKTNNKLKLNKKNSAGNIKHNNSLLEEYMTNMNEQIHQSNLISQNILHDLWLKNNSNRYKDEEELLSSNREDSLGKNIINNFNNNNLNKKLNDNLNNQIQIINDSFKEEEKNLDYSLKNINTQKNNNIINDIDFIKKELDWIDSQNDYFNNDELYENNIKFNIINKIGNELYNIIYNILSKKLNNNILEYNLSEIKKEIEKYLINKKYSNIDIKKCNNLIYDIYFLIISEKNKNK